MLPHPKFMTFCSNASTSADRMRLIGWIAGRSQARAYQCPHSCPAKRLLEKSPPAESKLKYFPFQSFLPKSRRPFSNNSLYSDTCCSSPPTVVPMAAAADKHASHREFVKLLAPLISIGNKSADASQKISPWLEPGSFLARSMTWETTSHISRKKSTSWVTRKSRYTVNTNMGPRCFRLFASRKLNSLTFVHKSPKGHPRSLGTAPFCFLTANAPVNRICRFSDISSMIARAMSR
mmetsp:Transcript_13332/g.33991  ORF Transcript_13332/g.33991 Transcript_13332/m.33991 type:complete len:235 (-) Transcript_13332:719-1423(-)